MEAAPSKGLAPRLCADEQSKRAVIRWTGATTHCLRLQLLEPMSLAPDQACSLSCSARVNWVNRFIRFIKSHEMSYFIK